MLKEKWTKMRVSLNSLQGGLGGRAGETESASLSDVGRGKSESDKAHFSQKSRSLIFWLQTRGMAGKRWWEEKKVLSNINIMKHS